jgi:hypothetical protein
VRGVKEESNLSATATKLVDYLAFHVVPIFQDNEIGRPVSIGSGLLTKHLGKPYLITAAHVVADNHADGPLYIYSGAAEKRALAGTWFANPDARNGANNIGKMDVAVLRLLSPEQPSLSISGKGCLSSDNFLSLASDHSFHGRQSAFLLTGFPSSKARLKLHRNELESELFSLLTHEAPLETYRYEGLDPNFFLLLKISAKSLFRNGIRVHAPDLNGMSGSPIWLLGAEGEEEQAPGFPVAGIAVEHCKASESIVAIRADAVAHLLRKAAELGVVKTVELDKYLNNSISLM